MTAYGPKTPMQSDRCYNGQTDTSFQTSDWCVIFLVVIFSKIKNLKFYRMLMVTVSIRRSVIQNSLTASSVTITNLEFLAVWMQQSSYNSFCYSDVCLVFHWELKIWISLYTNMHSFRTRRLSFRSVSLFLQKEVQLWHFIKCYLTQFL
jgi:hypothetical protein